MKLNNWIKLWREGKYVNIKDRTIDIYNYYLDNIVSVAIGDMEIEDINQNLLQKFILHLVNSNKYSSNTIVECFRVLKGILKDYMAHKDVHDKIFANINIPRNIAKKVTPFSTIEQKCLLQTIDIKKHPNQIGVILCMCTGLRLGELLALTWEDVDFDKNIINIDKSIYYKNKMCIQTSPKTLSSIRVVPLPKFLKPLLLSHKKTNKSIYIISRHGKRVIPRTYQYEFEMLLKHAKVKKKGFHALRHTFATNAVECGMDIKCLADILGHANPMITLKRYTHSMLDYKKSVMNKMGKIYFN